MFRFASPFFLILIVLILPVFYLRKRKQGHPAIRISAVNKSGLSKKSWAINILWAVDFLKYLALILVIIAMAKPQFGTERTTIKTEGVNIILAVDISESMAALDFKLNNQTVNRLVAVKDVVNNFISKRDGDRIGLVVFGAHAYTQIPLTSDYNAISTMLNQIEIGAAGKSTAIGDAIGISLKRLKDIESKTNIIILLTDGESNSGELSPEEATRIAANKDVKIYTVGVGSKGKAPFLIKHPLFGEQYVYQRVNIDEKTLKNIANQTNGIYFNAEDTRQLQDIYNQIDKLEKSEKEIKTFSEYNELYVYFLWPAFLLLTLWIILTNTRFLRIP